MPKAFNKAQLLTISSRSCLSAFTKVLFMQLLLCFYDWCISILLEFTILLTTVPSRVGPGLGWGAVVSCACLPPHQRGRNWFEHLPKLPTPRDRMCTPGLVNSIFLGPPWTKAPTSPPSHCLEQNWQGKHLNRHCLHETENPSWPRGRVYAETRGAGQLWLSSLIISFIPSHSSFSPTCCLNPTHLFLHFWLESRPLLLASSHVPHPNPSRSTRKGCPIPISFLQGCLPVSTCAAWLSTPSPTDLRAVAGSHQHSLLQLPTALQQLGSTAQPGQMRFIPSSSPSGEPAGLPALLAHPGAPQSVLGMLVLVPEERPGACGAPAVLTAVR